MSTRTLIFGNSGSGKSTLARALCATQHLPHLDLDTIVWEPNQVAVQRPTAAILQSLRDFLDANAAWVIEGCYGELIEAAAAECTELIFLNPGLDACLENNRRRPFEPHKYATAEAQQAMFENLQAWVAEYYVRDGSWSWRYHRRLFDAHRGPRREQT